MTRRFAAEFVFPAHPDKLADAVADAIVAEAVRRDRRSHVAVEVGLHREMVFVTGMLAGQGAAEIPVKDIVRTTFASAGFGSDCRPDPRRLRIHTDLTRSDLTSGPLGDRGRACDQCVVTGYATDIPETQFLPVEHWLANRLGRRLARLWREAPDLVLGPDGKVLVVVEEREAGSDAPSFRLRGLSCSIEQRERGNPVELHRGVRLLLEEEMEGLHRGFPQLDPDLPKSLRVNAAGTFSRGGPCGDNGLSGKKLVVDAYGPRAPIGGGALSGKDFYQVDRAGALHARRLAKQLVRTLPAPGDGSAAPREILVLMAWMPGDRAGRLLSVLDPRSGRPVRIFGPGGAASDRTLEASGGRWTGAADLIAVARHGHFTDPALPWERIASPWAGFPPTVPPPA